MKRIAWFMTVMIMMLSVCAAAETLVLPENISEIRDYAFMNCTQFTGNLEIPDSVVYIGAHAFDGCTGFTGTVYIPETATVDETAFDNTNLRIVVGRKQITMTYAEYDPLDTLMGQAAVAFKKKIEEISGGEIAVNLQASGVLGSEARLVKRILEGDDTVDIVRLSATALSEYDCVKAELLRTPYLFSGREHFWNFANSELAEEFLMEPQTLGLQLRGLSYLEEGFDNLCTTFPLDEVADLKRKKIRVLQDVVMVNMISEMGGNPTTVSFTELYLALQMGVVDGALQSIVKYRGNAFAEVAPYLTLTEHTIEASQIVITDNAWNKLTDEQKGWVLEAAQYASECNAELSAASDDRILKELSAEGVRITEPNKTRWEAACNETIADCINGQEETYKQIVNME